MKSARAGDGRKKKAETAQKLRELRLRSGLTLRDLSAKSGIAPSYLSNLERGANSPTLATLHKILTAMGADLETFFGPSHDNAAAGCVFKRENMRTVTDAARQYTFLLPRRPDIKAEILEEYQTATETDPEFESLECDVAGVVLGGILEFEVEDGNKDMLRAGDIFYVPAGKRHRGRCISSEPAHLITVYVPPKY
jgi:transcriptional regulator with XRE-family HTH domain